MEEQNTYLSFKIGEHSFGVSVDKVLEISEFKTPKPIPESPAYVLGVIEFRDQVVPVIDSAVKFNLGSVQVVETTCIIILELYNEGLGKRYSVGVVVDAVSDVFESNQDSLMAMHDDYRPGYIIASFKNDDNLVMILDVDQVFTEKDIISMDTIIHKLS